MRDMSDMSTATARLDGPATLADAVRPARVGRSRRSAAAVAVAACAALAPACGTSTPQRDFTPGGVASAAVATAPGGPADRADQAASAAGPHAETIDVGPGLQVRVEWPGALTADKAAMIKAYADGYAGQWRAVGSLGKNHSFLDGTEQPAAGQASEWVEGFVSRDYSARGLARLHSLRVASVSGRGAQVDACVDQSGVRLTDRAGVPVAKQPKWTKPPRSTWFQAAGVRKGDDGIWRIKVLQHADYPHELAKECLG